MNSEFIRMQELAGLNEIKVRKPEISRHYELSPKFIQAMSGMDSMDLYTNFGEEVTDALYLFSNAKGPDNKISISQIEKALKELPPEITDYWDNAESLLQYMLNQGILI